MGDPARGYSWPQFEPGHEISVRHGATSDRKVQPVADEIAGTLADIAPWAALPTFRSTVSAWAWAEAQAVLLRQYVDEHGMLDSDGMPLQCLALLERVEGRAARLRNELGLTPNAWAKLIARLGSTDQETAVRGLESLKAVGRELARTAALTTGVAHVE